MNILEIVFLSVHLYASMVWVGSVYMGTFIDWPSAKASVKEGEFPFKFIVGQGTRVFFSVYLGIAMLWLTGIGLTIMHPPISSREILMLGLKVVALFFMTAFTMYGSLSTWPKIQFSTDEEAHERYRWYMYRAVGTFLCGVLGGILGLWLY